jgi:hypothetical protein
VVTFSNPLDLGARHFGPASPAHFLPHNLIHRSPNPWQLATRIEWTPKELRFEAGK